MASVSQRHRTRSGKFANEHGRSNTTEHVVWRSMRQRCYDKNAKFYKHYGGRGIKVCDKWMESFQNFYDDMGARPNGTSLDRVDNNGDYSPDNCRWADQKTQSRNTRRNRRITIGGATKTLAEWIEKSSVKASTVKQRYYVYKWSAEEALGFTERRMAS